MCRSLMRTCHCRWHLCLTVEGSGRYNCRSTRSTHLSLMMVPYLSNSIVLVLDTCHMLFSLFGKYLEKKKNCGSSFHVSAWPAFRTSVHWSMGDLLEAGWLGESASGCPTSTSCTCVSPLVTPAVHVSCYWQWVVTYVHLSGTRLDLDKILDRDLMTLHLSTLWCIISTCVWEWHVFTLQRVWVH